MHFLVVSCKQCRCMYAYFFLHAYNCAQKQFSNAYECILVQNELVVFFFVGFAK